jgi:hypothetical protein
MVDIERSISDHPRLRIALVQPGSIGEGMAESLRSQSRTLPERRGLGRLGRRDDRPDSPVADELRFATRRRRRQPPGRREPGSLPGVESTAAVRRPASSPAASRSEPLRNTAYLIDAKGSVLGRYHKRVLMPWGEYAVGQEWVPGLRRVLGDIDELVPGTSAAPLTLSGRRRLGVLICYEDLTAKPPRQTVLEGGQVLFNLNNLTTFGDTPAAVQHQRLAAFRAIENRRWLVRCGTIGSTAVIGATGRVELQAPLREPAVLIASVPLLERHTSYTRHGDFCAWICVALTALGCLGERGRRTGRARRRYSHLPSHSRLPTISR